MKMTKNFDPSRSDDKIWGSIKLINESSLEKLFWLDEFFGQQKTNVPTFGEYYLKPKF